MFLNSLSVLKPFLHCHMWLVLKLFQLFLLQFQVHFIHLCISQCTSVYPSAPLYIPVHLCISQCTSVYPSAPLYIPVHLCISQCTYVYPSAPLYIPVHLCISQCTSVYPSAPLYTVSLYVPLYLALLYTSVYHCTPCMDHLYIGPSLPLTLPYVPNNAIVFSHLFSSHH